MGGNISQSSSKSKPALTPQQLISLYTTKLPEIMGVMTGQDSGMATTLAQSQAGAAPIYTQNDLSQLLGFAPQFVKVGTDIAQQQAGGTADLIAGEGGRAAEEAAALDKRLNPEYYAGKTATTDTLLNLLSSFGKGAELGGGELAAVERSVNRGNTATGNLGASDATNTVKNAMNFGEYARQKQSLLSQALTTATGTLSQLQNGNFNPVSMALGAGDTSKNAGFAQYSSKQAAPTAETGVNTALGILGSLTSSANATGSKSSSNSMGSSCCFIMLEAHNGVLPWWVRVCRDSIYYRRPDIAVGYRKMAKWLVPMMKRSRAMKWLVNNLMVQPITRHGGWLCNIGSYNGCDAVIKSFWFNMWSKLAK